MTSIENHIEKWIFKIALKKPALKSWQKSIDRYNYINLLIIKPFKAGAREKNIFFIPIDS
mgnify:CR=1 FL=1